MAKMLEGIKVLDFTMNAAGPIIGAYFADYGADVVKIEPPGGEAGRSFAYYINGNEHLLPAARTAASAPSR